MRILTLFLLLVISTSLFAQMEDSTRIMLNQWARYEEVRKEPAHALVLSLLVPGAGHFYVGRTVPGLMFLSGTIVGVLWVGSEIDRTGEATLGSILLLVAVRAVDLVSAVVSTQRYNSDLRFRLGISYQPHAYGPRFRLEIPI